ncbi:TPA: hypothetical protein I7241_05290 [Vibrio vulnificus]|nr:hypothetical protein [Vibrio vulnificus]
MKSKVVMLVSLAALWGCDDASKAIEQAQLAANKAVDEISQQVESFDFSTLTLEQFGEAAATATELLASVEDLMSTDLSDPQALLSAQEKIANTYSCLVSASSENSAQALLDKVMATVADKNLQQLIEKATQKAEMATECVI